jgi:phosphatidylglycerol:prolipoprotein diacylglycerol transferase
MYGTARFIAEFWRQPDVQLGYLYGDWLTMGQIQSFIMILISIGVYMVLKNYMQKKSFTKKKKAK